MVASTAVTLSTTAVAPVGTLSVPVVGRSTTSTPFWGSVSPAPGSPEAALESKIRTGPSASGA